MKTLLISALIIIVSVLICVAWVWIITKEWKY